MCERKHKREAKHTAPRACMLMYSAILYDTHAEAPLRLAGSRSSSVGEPVGRGITSRRHLPTFAEWHICLAAWSLHGPAM